MRKKNKLPKAYRRPVYVIYQPIIEIKTGKIFGYEALMRGDSSAFLPEDLFRDAYKKGCVTAFDARALRASFDALPKLQKEKCLFVNIEPITLGETFAKKKESSGLLKLIRIYSKQLVFELTERLKPWDFDFVKKGISVLVRTGARFALDDVGGVGSELIKLMTLKPDYIKIDKDLIQNASKSPLQQESLEKLVEYANKKRVKLIAEGIEKKSEYESIKRLDIHYAQGFYLAQPKREMYDNLIDYR